MTRTNVFDSHKRDKWLRFSQELSPETNPEVIRLMGQLRMVSHSLYVSSEQNLSESGLSYAQYRILVSLLYNEMIEGNPTLNPSEISHMQGTSRNTVSALIRSLEEAALIVRELDADDRRKFNIRLTDAGRDLVREHSAEHFHLLDQVFTVLAPDEMETLTSLLERISEAIYNVRAVMA
ncbi:MAG: MarR family transcriptional regulator [Anaerolineae bacterium]|nr:MarR family transcriptional regulator [Anaerolineae bacterium]